MLSTAHSRILHELLNIPTAPFAEHLVIEYIERFCAARKPALTLTRDRVGNMLIRVKKGHKKVARPICLTAHLDHPGFVADKMIGPTRLRAFWRGGVPVEYFVGAKVRFWVDGRWVRGTIRSVKPIKEHQRLRVDTTVIDVARNVPPNAIGMWDFPDAKVRGNRIHARGCDDIAGAAAILCCLDKLARSATACDAYVLFTRAEEVGFVGAIAACQLKTVSHKCLVVTVETSSELPSARMGDGPILRVGDKTSAFTPAATAFCQRVVQALKAKGKGFDYQRKLMDGGTCEASAFCHFGYEATGLCLALGNYHNVDRKRKKLGPEYIDLDDFDNLVKWFVALVRSPSVYEGHDPRLGVQLEKIERSYKKLLTSSVKQPC